MRVNYQIGIVGAGFGGIIAALDLKRSGMASFVIFERAPEPGGVWRDNVYPGCACDIRSHLYSIESDPNPDWSSSYASQPEIFQYLKDVVRRHDLQRHIRYSATVTEVRFLEEDGCWLITDQTGEPAASEPLSSPPDRKTVRGFLPSRDRKASAERHSTLQLGTHRSFSTASGSR